MSVGPLVSLFAPCFQASASINRTLDTQRSAPAPPHRTVREVLPHTALRCPSSCGIRFLPWRTGIVSSTVLELHLWVWLALKAFTNSYPFLTRGQSSAPSLGQGYVVLTVISTMGTSDSPSWLPFPFHGLPLIGSVTPGVTSRPGGVSPVPKPTVPTFRSPYTGGFFGAALPSSSRLPWPSPKRARLGSLLTRSRGKTLTMRQDSLYVTDCRVVMTSLRRSDYSWRRMVTTGRLGPYPDRTFTG